MNDKPPDRFSRDFISSCFPSNFQSLYVAKSRDNIFHRLDCCMRVSSPYLPSPTFTLGLCSLELPWAVDPGASLELAALALASGVVGVPVVIRNRVVAEPLCWERGGFRCGCFLPRAVTQAVTEA